MTTKKVPPPTRNLDPPSNPRAVRYRQKYDAATMTAIEATMSVRYNQVRWLIVSGSPTVGGFGGYLRAGISTTATKAADATFATRWNSLRPARR